jgi:hypothetical protein
LENNNSGDAGHPSSSRKKQQPTVRRKTTFKEGWTKMTVKEIIDTMEKEAHRYIMRIYNV